MCNVSITVGTGRTEVAAPVSDQLKAGELSVFWSGVVAAAQVSQTTAPEGTVASVTLGEGRDAFFEELLLEVSNTQLSMLLT